MINVKMPQGTYYIGDPCYINHGPAGFKWIEKLWDTYYHTQGHNGRLNIDGVYLFIQNTYEGDGAFDGFYVDSGTIAIIKIDDLINDERFNFKNMVIKGTKFVRFNKELNITYEEGLFNINNEIVINTKCS
jgi:hypothetical protein